MNLALRKEVVDEDSHSTPELWRHFPAAFFYSIRVRGLDL
jgi:hypothetical protein